MSVSTLVGTVFGNVGNNLGIQSYLPSTIFVLFLFSLAFMFSERPSQFPDLGLLVNRLQQLDLASGFVVSTVIIALTLIIQPLQIIFIRLLEGYWGDSKIGSWIRRNRGMVHEQILTKLERDASDVVVINGEPTPEEIERLTRQNMAELRRVLYYPDRSRVLPTALGNILRATEDRSGNRYGLDTVEMWPRLYPLIEGNLKNMVDDLRSQLDTAVRFCVVFIGATLLSVGFYFLLVYEALLNDFPINLIYFESTAIGFPASILPTLSSILAFMLRYSGWLIIPISTMFLAWVSYKSAISVAVIYGKSVATAFDFYRFELLKKFHIPLPENLFEEKNQNEKLSNFCTLGVTEENILYEHPSEENNVPEENNNPPN